MSDNQSVVKDIDPDGYVAAIKAMSIQDLILLMVELEKHNPPNEPTEDWRVW